jgi:uncharacterized membrane protein YdjX (TVP38/TMEM64 family)
MLRVSGESLWVLCLLLFADGATFAVASTPLLLHYGHFHEPWRIALIGGAASALGSSLQLLVLRWIMGPGRAWMRRFAPSREKLESALRAYPSASFLALVVARATPLPDAPLKLVAAAAEYPVPLYGLASYFGSLPYYYALALIGSKVHIPVWMLVGAVGLVGLAVLVDRWRRSRTRAAGAP